MAQKTVSEDWLNSLVSSQDEKIALQFAEHDLTLVGLVGIVDPPVGTHSFAFMVSFQGLTVLIYYPERRNSYCRRYSPKSFNPYYDGQFLLTDCDNWELKY